MKVSGVHWGIFALIMVLSIAAGIIVADKYLDAQAQKTITE